MMLRCAESAGRYRLSLRIAHHPEPYRVQVIGHRDVLAADDGRVLEAAPVVGTTEPYEGELCAHELQWLNGVPGKDWRPEYEFTIERLDPPAAGPA
jgi:hypothetical protein